MTSRARLGPSVVALICAIIGVGCGGGSYADLSVGDAEQVARDHLGVSDDVAAVDVRLDTVDRHDCAQVTFDGQELVVLSAGDGHWAVMDNGNPNLGSGYDPGGRNCLNEP